jgi:uncharacterized membrane protein
MNQTQIHLLANHLPVMGFLFGIIVLVYGMASRSIQTRNAAYLVFIIAAIGGIIAFNTGEGAEEAVEHLAGISEEAIEAHEEAAETALIGIVALGIGALLTFILAFKKPEFEKRLSVAVLLISLAALGITIYSANLGGKIMHKEVYENSEESSKTVEH